MTAEQKKASEERILECLRGVREENPVLQAVLELLDYQAEIADQRTLDESVSPDRRSYFAGQEAAIKMVRSSLAVMHARANKA